MMQRYNSVNCTIFTELKKNVCMAIAMSCMPNIHVNMHACTNSCKDSLTYVFASGKDKTHEFTDFVN